MPKELFWLTLTVALTGLMWIPYILDRARVGPLPRPAVVTVWCGERSEMGVPPDEVRGRISASAAPSIAVATIASSQ